MTAKRTLHYLFSASLLSLSALLQGCATLNKDECQLADWRLIGYQDGAAGKSATVVGEYREDCAKHAVVPDLDEYSVGRAEGLREYCRAENGFRLGNAGRGLAAVCPSALAGDFREAYNAGRKLYLARSEVNQTHSRINSHKQTLSSLEQTRAEKLAALVGDGLKSDQRVMILYELNELQDDMHSVEDELVELEFDLEKQQARLERLDRKSAY